MADPGVGIVARAAALLSLVLFAAGVVRADPLRSREWPISLDESKGASFDSAGLKAIGGATLRDGLVLLSTTGDGFEAMPGDLGRFVVEMDLDKPSAAQSFDLRFLDREGTELFRIEVLGGGRLSLNGTLWMPRDYISDGRARYLFAVDQKAKRFSVLLQYATASKAEKAFDESEFVSYSPAASISRVVMTASGDGAIAIREFNVFCPDIVSVGDSTCQGGTGYSPIPTLTREPRSWSFQYHLEKLIDPPARVTNLGFSGHRLGSMKRHVDRAEKLGARICLAIIGVNTITAKKSTDEEVQNQYREWVQYAVSKGLRPVCCTMFPKSYGADKAAQAQYDMLNDWIRKNVPSLGGDVIEIHDQMVGEGGLSTPSELTSDGHHPNGQGYRKAAGIIRKGLQPALEVLQRHD